MTLVLSPLPHCTHYYTCSFSYHKLLHPVLLNCRDCSHFLLHTHTHAHTNKQTNTHRHTHIHTLLTVQSPQPQVRCIGSPLFLKRHYGGGVTVAVAVKSPTTTSKDNSLAKAGVGGAATRDALLELFKRHSPGAVLVHGGEHQCTHPPIHTHTHTHKHTHTHTHTHTHANTRHPTSQLILNVLFVLHLSLLSSTAFTDTRVSHPMTTTCVCVRAVCLVQALCLRSSSVFPTPISPISLPFSPSSRRADPILARSATASPHRRCKRCSSRC
jgi:hypothetical protein